MFNHFMKRSCLLFSLLLLLTGSEKNFVCAADQPTSQPVPSRNSGKTATPTQIHSKPDSTAESKKISPNDSANDSDKKLSGIRLRKLEKPVKKLFRGKVHLLKDVLDQLGIESRPEAAKQVVLVTDENRMFPLLSDWRGRAFYQDKKLRDRTVELVCQQYKDIPYLQVLMIYTFNKQGERQYTDYWCDICAIPMYEIKPCDCCQGPIELRFQVQDLPSFVKKSLKQKSSDSRLNSPSRTD